jgi:hypothetical protein
VLDKDKLLEWIDSEIESCKIVKTSDDQAIIWELQRLKKRIESGLFDIKEQSRCDICPDDEETCYCYDDKPLKKECDWCGEDADELSHPHMFDMAIGKKMCQHCWNHDREVYKGSYGEDIGEFKPVKEVSP